MSKPIYTWSQLKAVQDHLDDIDKRLDRTFKDGNEPELRRLDKIYSELAYQSYMMSRRVIPEPGMPCFIVLSEDEVCNGTIVEAEKRAITVRLEDGSVRRFRHRLNNNWTSHKSKCFPGLWLHAGNAVKEIVSPN